MERDNYDFVFKLVIIGNSNCGKSCLLHYFLENKCKMIINNKRKEFINSHNRC
jgi:GTPase SAR1 family protein